MISQSYPVNIYWTVMLSGQSHNWPKFPNFVLKDPTTLQVVGALRTLLSQWLDKFLKTKIIPQRGRGWIKNSHLTSPLLRRLGAGVCRDQKQRSLSPSPSSRFFFLPVSSAQDEKGERRLAGGRESCAAVRRSAAPSVVPQTRPGRRSLSLCL